jgi:hypothetical protein
LTKCLVTIRTCRVTVPQTTAHPQAARFQRFGETRGHFIEAVDFLDRAASERQTGAATAIENREVLDAVVPVVPADGTPHEFVLLQAASTTDHILSVSIDVTAGNRIVEAYKNLTEDSRMTTGTIVEVSLRSGSFIVHMSNYREVTCYVGAKMLRNALFAFNGGDLFTVEGVYSRRSRRDLLRVKPIALSDGTVIDRASES